MHQERERGLIMIIANGVLEKYTGKDEEVVIPDGVTAIGDWAFAWASVKKVIIPDSVTRIGNGAFYKCSAKVTVPASVTSIGAGAFSNGYEVSTSSPSTSSSLGEPRYYTRKTELLCSDGRRISAETACGMSKAELKSRGIEVSWGGELMDHSYSMRRGYC